MSKGSRSPSESDGISPVEASLVEELERVIRQHAAEGVDLNGRAFELRNHDPETPDWEVTITELAK